MTGLEGVAIGAAGKAASEVVKAGSESAKVSREIRKAEQAALVEAAKDTPGFRRAAEIRGRKLAVKEQWGLVLMSPLAGLMGVSREYFKTDFATDFAEKIADIPEENLQTPKASIAGPAMEGLGYSLDEPELKALYLELLAKAADDRSARATHPSFVEVIRSITAEEAVLLQFVLGKTNETKPIVEYRMVYAPRSDYVVLSSHVLNTIDRVTDEPKEDSLFPSWVDNWIRLGLVEVHYDRNMSDSGVYDWAEARPERVSAQAVVDRFEPSELEGQGLTGATLETTKGILITTARGSAFAEAVGLR